MRSTETATRTGAGSAITISPATATGTQSRQAGHAHELGKPGKLRTSTSCRHGACSHARQVGTFDPCRPVHRRAGRRRYAATAAGVPVHLRAFQPAVTEVISHHVVKDL